MKAIYRKHVHEQFDGAMALRLPEFAPFVLRLTKEQRKEATLFAGSRIYRRVVAEGLHLFIHVIPHRTQEEFLLEVGWSTLGRFPHQLTSNGIPTADGTEMERQEWLIDFGGIFHRRFGRSHLGWEVWRCSVAIDDPNYIQTFIREDLAPVSDSQARERVQSAVTQCIDDIEAVVLPYFDEMLRRKQPVAGSVPG